MAIDAREEVKEWVDTVTPEMLYMDLRQKVWGQDREILKAATLIFAFFYNLIYGNGEKYHFLIEGTSGCGKSTFAHALKSAVPFPVIIADASQVTASGYKGAEASALVDDETLLQEWCGCGIIIKAELDGLEKQFEVAKVEVKKPFAKEQELKEKTDRLNVLNGLLNVDKRDNEFADDEPGEVEETTERKEKDLER